MEGVWTIVITAAASVVATLGTTWFGHWLGLSKDRALRDEEMDRHARYLAIRVVCVLDPVRERLRRSGPRRRGPRAAGGRVRAEYSDPEAGPAERRQLAGRRSGVDVRDTGAAQRDRGRRPVH